VDGVPSVTRQVPAGNGALPLSMPYQLSGGQVRQEPLSLFWKAVLAPGEYRHPVTGQLLRVDEPMLHRLAETANNMIAAGEEIPTPVDHSDSARDNLGWVVDAKVEGGRLHLLHAAIGAEAAGIALRNRASVLLDPDYADAKGRRWGPAIIHSAYTAKPVVGGMDSFRPLFAASRPGAPAQQVPVLSLTPEPDMLTDATAAHIRAVLGLPANAPVGEAEIRAVIGLPALAATPASAAAVRPGVPSPVPAPAPVTPPAPAPAAIPAPAPLPAPAPVSPPTPAPNPGGSPTNQPAPAPAPAPAPGGYAAPLAFAASAVPAPAPAPGAAEEAAATACRLYDAERRYALSRNVLPAAVTALDAIFAPGNQLAPHALTRTADGRYAFEAAFASLGAGAQLPQAQYGTFAAGALAAGAAGSALPGQPQAYARTVPGNTPGAAGQDEIAALDKERREKAEARRAARAGK
jgi:hypothetical protein